MLSKKDPAKNPSVAALSGIPASAESFVLAELLHGKLAAIAPDTIIHIAISDREVAMLASALAFFAPDAEILEFPAWDTLPYDRVSPQPGIMAKRMHTLSLLSQRATKKRVVLTTINAITQKLPPKNRIQHIGTVLKLGDVINQNQLVEMLVAQGYRRAGKAMESGEFALRGSIIDIVPVGMNEGVRIDLFGDDVESIKPFDPMTQLTNGKVESVALFPVSEVLLTEETREQFRTRYRELFGAVTKEDPLYAAISEGNSYPGMEHWLPLFYTETATLLDYASNALVTQSAGVNVAMEERWETIRDYYEARTQAIGASSKKNSFAGGVIYHPVPAETAFVMQGGWERRMENHPHAEFSSLGDDGYFGLRAVLRFAQGNADHTPFDQLKERVRAAADAKKSTVIACYSEGSLDRLQSLLMEREFHAVRLDSWKDARNLSGKTIGLCVLALENGFETKDTLILSEQDVLGERIVRATKKKKSADVFMQEAANFTEGELVVHKEHGIGRFEGLITLTVSGASHDCLKLIYDGGDKLFLPVENIDMVTRFGADDEGVTLDKLGGASWQSRKAKLKERIKIAAELLLRTAAERQIKPGEVIEVPHGSYDEFCSRFPYAETEDQERSIDDVKTDLASGKPMDRLICGDVGFGKTEVALRGAYIAACNPDNKMQVAVITPTTLLARQHYKNFKERFAGFPVEVRQLSRMVPAKEMKETKERLASGDVGIVIGTHALLAKSIEFKKLGLVIVDEEQHFGVGQKEKLKELKSDVHVLTLSATPIPRTLQMALTGVRDLSLITTPPVDRLAVRSFVMPYDPVVIKEAILREKHRGGRSFIVCPRIKDIADIKAKMNALIPDIKIAVAHGQLAPSALDDIMNDFYDGKYDALLSTAIIESGIDIPTANTMIIFNAHMFGLAQLYQLRGRVGRAKTRAYAYFILPHHKELTKNAAKRLEVMQTLDTLGAGFSLASHDMDIRGFGNLVGEEQSGHIREVGIELYQQMLEEAVEAMKRLPDPGQTASAPVNNDWSPTINLGLSVLIPETYVNDLDLRLGLYRRLSGLESDDDINSFAGELVDRFGKMPEEVAHLIAVLGIKLLCKKAGIERIDVGPKGAVISFRGNVFANPDALLKHIDRNPRTLKARPDQKLVFTHEWKNPEETIAVIKKLVSDIGGLITLKA